jgi:hypothetical protein
MCDCYFIELNSPETYKLFWILVRLFVEANFLKFNGVVLSVVSDVPVDSKAFTMTLLISKIYRLSLQRCL